MSGPRNMLFISHATPEDNQFTMWLALRLAAEGYPVWCDLTKLLGGEPFWKEIETAIRERTCKFLFVLSQYSNSKEGTRDELEVATTVGKNWVMIGLSFRCGSALARSRPSVTSSTREPLGSLNTER